MLIKYAGIILLVLFCLSVGDYFAHSKETEYKMLCLINDMLFDIKCFIGFESMTLKAILTELNSKDSYKDICFLSSEYDESNIREELISNLKALPPFQNDEYNSRLIRLFTLIGTTDKSAQLELIEGTAAYYSGQESKIREELPIKKRLYKSLGFAAGALLSVILI